MAVEKIDAELLARMFMAGAQNLSKQKDVINELNVFPVPDGDTGTNMTMTIMSAVHEIQALDKITMKSLCKCISSGSLRGARGNSGVILSQLFRGFTKVVKGADEIDIPMIADAFEKAVETAYKAVIKPKEGTILTVAKGMAEIARKLVDAQMTLEEYARNIIDYGNQVLQKTPDMLPVLKEAGVVDSGGQGLMAVLEGCDKALLGEEVDMNFGKDEEEADAAEGEEPAEKLKFGYCTEFILHTGKALTEAQTDEFRTYLKSEGEEVVAVREEKQIKTYLHTNDPGMVITRALTMGYITNVKVTNLAEEHHECGIFEDPKKAAEDQEKERQKKENPPKPVGFVTVAAGDGFADIFRGIGADEVISGGQTMNPSTEDVLNAVDAVNAENIFIFPNNKNIIMAAKQAKELVREKNIIVIETKNIPQGISALLAFDPSKPLVDNQAAMNEAVGHVKTAELTYAIRDTKIDDKDIHQGDIMAVGDNGILSIDGNVHDAAIHAVDALVDDDTELVTLYYGKDFSEENANRIACEIQKKYPDRDVAVENGGQPVYYCIISVE